jgi:L-alanine-DL-glutamate epimerase-like enolase superfamily enzyme
MFWFGRGGAVEHAISGIDIALWDLLGKVTKQPVARLLGGIYRDKIKPYASILFDDPPTVVAGVNYLATYSAIRYAATQGANMTWPYTTAHMYTASSLGSRFDAGPVGTVPTQVSGAGYHVSPIVRFAA